MKETVSKTFTITASPQLIARFERLLALLHYSSGWGHSGVFGMPLDGDGSEKISVSPRPAFNHECDAIMGVGYDVELAKDTGYGGVFVDRNRECKWYTGAAANLYRNGEVIKTVPSQDWSIDSDRRHKETSDAPPK